jgi:hypothetical protein
LRLRRNCFRKSDKPIMRFLAFPSKAEELSACQQYEDHPPDEDGCDRQPASSQNVGLDRLSELRYRRHVRPCPVLQCGEPD